MTGRPKVVLLGMMTKIPVAGVVWQAVHYLRGFTRLDDSLPEAQRGTYLGAAQKASYLKELGVTAVEFLPIQESREPSARDDLQFASLGV